MFKGVISSLDLETKLWNLNRLETKLLNFSRGVLESASKKINVVKTQASDVSKQALSTAKVYLKTVANIAALVAKAIVSRFTKLTGRIYECKDAGKNRQGYDDPLYPLLRQIKDVSSLLVSSNPSPQITPQ